MKIFSSKFLQKNHNSEEGITLLLSIFIMVGITLIASTVAFLSIQQIRGSRATLYSTPAFAAAKAGVEEGIWKIKRPDTFSGGFNGCYSVTSTGAAGSYCAVYSAADFKLSSGDANAYTFSLYDPYAPNGCDPCVNGESHPTDLSGMTPDRYSELTVTIPSTATHSVSIYVSRFDGTTIGAQPETVSTASPGRAKTIPISYSGRDGLDNRLLVKLVYWLGGSAGTETTVSVDTNVGMPTFPTIDAVGCAGKIQPQAGCPGGNSEQFNRRLNVVVPR